MPYIPYTDEQKQLANSVDLPTFLRMRGETLVPVGREFKLVYHDGYGKHDSITISGTQWYDHKNQIGGGPIKFMREHYGMNFQEAMQALLGHSALPLTHEAAPVMAKEKKEFRLPDPNDNMHRVYAYLIKQRFIAPEVITHFAKKKLLYEDKKHHNAVFVGIDSNGIPRQAHKRSTTTFGNSFRQTIEGSDTKYSFAHFGKSNMLFVFEAPIDMLSFITLYQSYNGINGTNSLNVYLPYGYDKNKKYNIFYFMHGMGDDENTSLYNDNGEMQRVFDNMINNGDIEPMIIVTPTFNKCGSDTFYNAENFYKEFRESVVPFVEDKYSTYAESTSKEDIAASRMHRAYGGFSMGSVSTWAVYENCLDIVGYFMPLSGAHHWGTGNADAVALANTADRLGLKKNEYFIMSATGTSDFAYSVLAQQIEDMKKQSQFEYTSDFSKGNFWFILANAGEHGWYYVRQYLYNCLPFFFRQ